MRREWSWEDVLTSSRGRSAFAERGLAQPETARVERRGRLVVHRVGGDLEHLVLEAHGITGGPRFEIEPAIEREPRRIAAGLREMRGTGARERQPGGLRLGHI